MQLQADGTIDGTKEEDSSYSKWHENKWCVCGLWCLPPLQVPSELLSWAATVSGSSTNAVLAAQSPSDFLGLREIQLEITYRNNEPEEVMMTHVTNKANVISMVIQRSSLLSFGFY